MGCNMNFTTLLASAKAKAAIILAALIAVAVALWEAYSKGRDSTLDKVKAGEADDLRDTINTVTDVNDMLRDRPPNIAISDIKPTVPDNLPRLGEGTNTPASTSGAVRLDQANPDSSAGRLNILVQAEKENP